MSAFVKRHFFMGLAALGLLLMAGFVVLRATGLVGGDGGGQQAAQAGPAGKGGGPGAGKGGGGGGRPQTVVLTDVNARTFDDRISVPGTVLANESITVTTKVQDLVEDVRFESGQFVRAGTVLVVLARSEQAFDAGGAASDVDAAFADANAAFNEADSLGRDLEAARAGVQEAEAQLTQARLAFDRTRTLADRGFASQARLDADRALLDAAEARVRGARERVAGVGQRIESQRQRASALRARVDSVAQRQRSAQSRLSDRTIRAPFSGVIGLRNVSPGQLARPGEALATLDDISQVKVDFAVPESRMQSVRPGTEVTLRSEAVPGMLWRGFVRYVDTRVDPRSRTLTARAYIANPDGALRPGMLLDVDVRTPARSMPGIPEVALQEEGNETFVFIAVEGDSGLTARRVPVRIGTRRDGWVEVLDGIAIGDRVVSEGLVRLRDGQAIRPQNGPSSPAKAPAPGAPAPGAPAPGTPAPGTPAPGTPAPAAPAPLPPATKGPAAAATGADAAAGRSGG